MEIFIKVEYYVYYKVDEFVIDIRIYGIGVLNKMVFLYLIVNNLV